MNMFKESFTEYNESSNTLSGPQSAFASSLLEGIDSSRNVYNTYNSYYRNDDIRIRGHLHERPVKKEPKSELSDNSLLYMGLGVAGLGAVVIVVMALRK